MADDFDWLINDPKRLKTTSRIYVPGTSPKDDYPYAQITPSTVAAWTPASEGSNLTFWVDAQTPTTINTGTPVDSDPVSTWIDQSSNAYQFTQSGAARFTYSTAGIGTHPAMVSTSTQGMTGNSHIVLTSGTACTIASYMKLTSISSGGFGIYLGLYTNALNKSLKMGFANAAQGVGFRGWSAGVNGAAFGPLWYDFTASANTYAMILTYNGGNPTNAANWTLSVNGVVVTVQAGGAGWGVNTANTTYIGGAGSDSTFGLVGAHGEHMMFTKVDPTLTTNITTWFTRWL